MNLREFTAQSLEQIVRGVADAAKAVADLNARINPQIENLPSNAITFHRATGTEIRTVDFDVAVTIESTTTAGGEIGLGIRIFSAKASGAAEDATSYVSRVRYSVPVAFPPDSRPKND